jgi:hypothetical protein
MIGLNATRTVYGKSMMGIFAFSWKVVAVCLIRHLPAKPVMGPCEAGGLLG